MNADTPQARLEGLVPMVEDWHTKTCLLGVIPLNFFSITEVKQ